MRARGPIGLLAGLLWLAPLGCGRAAPETLVVATNWDAAACEDLEREIAPASGPLAVRWIRVAPGEDPTRAATRAGAVDAVLGGPTGSFERLRAEGRLQPADGRPWLALPGPSRGDAEGLIAARGDPAAWAAAYARLVREVAAGGEPLGGEGAALVAGSGREGAGRALLDRLRGRAVAAPPVEALLLPDLLDATLGEAREEWLAARRALAEAGSPARTLALFAEAPPWPPASVAKMRSRADGEALLATLAGQVAPDPDAREWLLASWSGPTRPIDGTTLATLARAADGRLAAEPRFRAWLRSEWTAWARQRYRRVVARLDDPRYSPP